MGTSTITKSILKQNELEDLEKLLDIARSE